MEMCQTGKRPRDFYKHITTVFDSSVTGVCVFSQTGEDRGVWLHSYQPPATCSVHHHSSPYTGCLIQMVTSTAEHPHGGNNDVLYLEKTS